MASKELACIWLDKLLQDKSVKEFRIPGSERGDAPKIKINLECEALTM